MAGKHRLRKLGIALGIIIVLLIAFRLALPSIIHRYVNRKLNELPEYTGKVGDIDIHLWRGAYTIKDVDILKKTGQVPVPFVSALRVDLSVEWRELFHGAAVGEIVVEDGHLNFVKGPTPEDSQTSVDDVWLKVVKDLFPFKINRFEIREGGVRFNDFHSNPKVDLFITNVVAVATNLTNSRKFNTKLPADFQVAGDTLGGGKIKLHVKLDPLAEKPTFELNLDLTRVDLTAMNDLLEAYGKFNVKRGSFQVVSEIAAENGQFQGYVKPFFEDLDVLDLQRDAKNPIKLVWQAIVAGAVQLFKNHPKDQVATKIPITGSFDNPKVSIWTTVVNVLRNAFVQAFSPTFDRTVDIFNKGDASPDDKKAQEKQDKEIKKQIKDEQKKEKKKRKENEKLEGKKD